MDSRKSLIDVGVYTIKDSQGKTYKIDKKYNVRYGGSALIYHVEADGKNYMLKECYPSCLADKLERKFDGCLSLSGNSFLVDIEDEEVFENFKQLALKEHETITSISKSRKYFKSKNDFIYASNTPFEANGTIYTPIETTDSISLAEMIEKWDKTDFSEIDLKNIFHTIQNLLLATENLHNSGFLHLDICPENVVISNANVIRLIDFNSSCQINNIPAKHSFSFKEGYSAIELKYRAKGITYGKIDRSTDLYSIGSILFRIFCGRTITTFDKTCSIEWESIAKNNCRVMTHVDESTDLAMEIVRIIKKATSNDSNVRYKSTKELLSEIQTIIDFIVSAPAIEEKNRIRKKLSFFKKHYIVAFFSLLIIIGLVGASVVCSPNVMDGIARKELYNGNGEKAYNILLKIHNKFNPLIHCFYSQEKTESLAWEIYHQNSVTTINYDEPVVQSVLNSDNEIVTLLNDKIVINNPLVKESSRIYSVINSDGYLSWNGSFYATTSDENLVVYYMDSFENEPQIIAKNVRNFSFDEIGSSLAIVDTNNKLKTINLLTQESTEKNLSERQVLNYAKGQKTLDFNSNSTKIAFIDTNGCANVFDMTSGEVNTHVPTNNSTLKFIQLSTDADANPTVQLSDLSSQTYEYNFKDDYFGLAISPLRYNYMISPDSGWRILWHSSSSLKDKTLYISDKSVTLELCVTDAMNHVRIMPSKGDSPNKEYFKLFDICDIEGNYYYDFDNQEKKLFRTHINEPVEQILPVICDFDLNNVSTLTVHDDNVMIKSDDRIAFFKIENNTVILNGKPIILPEKTIHAGAEDKKTFAYTDDGSIIIYKYKNSEWRLFDKIPLRNGNNLLHLILFNEDGTRFCIEYANHNKEITTIDIYDLSTKCKLEETKEIKGILFDVISNDLEHGFAFYPRTSAPLEKVLIYNFLTNVKTDLGIKDTSKESLIRGTKLAIKNHIITKRIEVDKPQHTKIYDNEKALTQKCYAVSNVIKISENQICFIVRDDDDDYLITYDVVSAKSVKKPMSNHLFEQLPIQYDLMYIDDNFTAISAIYNGAVMNTLHQDLTLDQLLKKCEDLYK